MSEIVLIRHGQASFGAKNYDRLSPLGIRQSEILADHLLACGADVDAVYCGRLHRQQDTARALCGRFGADRPALASPAVRAAFDEYDARALLVARSRLRNDPGAVPVDALAGLRRDRRAFQAYFSDTVDRWLAGAYDGDTAVEPWPIFCSRVAGGIREIIEHHGRGSRLAVFTSGGPISVVLKTALGLSDRMTVKVNWQIMNASLTRIRTDGERLTLTGFNDITHLLLAKDPALLTYR